MALQRRALQAELATDRARNIPAIPMFPVLNRTFNFAFMGLVDAYSFSPRDLCLMIGICDPNAISGCTVFPAMQSVKLNSVELWAGQSSVAPAGPVNPTVQAWVSRTLTNGNPVRLLGNVKQDVATQTGTVPAHMRLDSKQRSNSILRQWFEQDDQDYLFTVCGAIGTVMQINVSYTLATAPGRLANSIQSIAVQSYACLGLTAIDTGNPAGSRIVLPIPLGLSVTNQVPIFD